MTDNSEQPFSARFGHRSPVQRITIRDDAPGDLRYALLQIAADEGELRPYTLRDIICGLLRKRPDPSNWSEYPNVENEVYSLVFNCEWYRVYDIVEAISKHLAKHQQRAPFEAAVNECFRELGIGWRLKDGKIETRGDDSFESVMSTAQRTVKMASLPTAEGELLEAIRDISRRPEPDLSGAVHHAMAALECVARKATGNSKDTLGQIVKRNPGLIPRPLDDAIEKCWGYSSEVARHGREDRTLCFEEVQLVVGLAAVFSTYLSGKQAAS